MSDDHRDERMAARRDDPLGRRRATPSSFVTGYRYAAMGYTAAFEPAMVPSNARSAPISRWPICRSSTRAPISCSAMTSCCCASSPKGAEQERINDYVAWMLRATAPSAVKTVNPGGISAFKFNAPRPRHRRGRAASRRHAAPDHLQALERAVFELGVPHPLHVHCNNLGVPGNIETTLATIAAAEGFPMHLTHAQFHSYGAEGDRHFSSAAARLAEAVNRNPNVTSMSGRSCSGRP